MRSLITLILLSLLTTSCVVAVDEDSDGFAGCPSLVGFVLGNDPTCESHDQNPHVFPGAPEICDGLDNDLDGTTDEGFDADLDGHFDASDAGCFLAYNGEADCDDADPENFPGNTEVCDGADNDCDGSTWAGAGESDADLDGHRVCEGDCRDDRPETHPGAPEICDGFDNDCDGFTPEVEFDGDSDEQPACEDCDDDNAANFYGNTEVCDDLDNDCDDLADAADADTDEDADGFSHCDLDCNDTLASIHPDATEVCDGVDNDCDGEADEGFDQDGDLFTSCAGDCNDGNDAFNPAVEEICDGFDNDCSGAPEPDEVDLDSDGHLACAECDDTAAWNFPGNAEVCDDLDNDCDGALSPEELDDDFDGMTECQGDCDDADEDIYDGAPEICDDQDNDCDGFLSDEELDDDLDEETECQGDCDDAAGWNFPGNPEVCDGVDNDCNGQDDVLGYAGSETDADLDTQSECEGDCDDGDSFLNTLDEDADGFDTCFEGDCDEDSVYGYRAHPGNVSEVINAYSCTDWQDNDCDGLEDYEDETDCPSSCPPDLSMANLFPNSSFEMLPLLWYEVTTNEPGGNLPDMPANGGIQGDRSLRMRNLTPGSADSEQIAMNLGTMSAGNIHVSFAGHAEGSLGIAITLQMTSMGDLAQVFCTLEFTVLNQWHSYVGCCELPELGEYVLLLSYGTQTPSNSNLYIDVANIYPSI